MPGNERRNYHRFLYHLIEARRPAVALEIGVQWATASAHMVEAAKAYKGLVIGIDVITRREPVLLQQKSKHYVFIHGDSTDPATMAMVTNLVKTFGKIGLVFQDSSHHYLPSVREWELYRPLLDDEAIWVCDDITPSFYNEQSDPPGKGMVQYFNERPGQKKLYINSLHYGNAQGVILL